MIIIMLFISPPFGNYINLSNSISIRGSFTLNERPGKWMQILKTLRYIPGTGWINKIGLRNPGINYAVNTYKKGEIISIAILYKKEIPMILKKIPEDMDIELNVSCPNTDKHMINDGLKPFINKKRKWCIIKLSPLTNHKTIDKLYKDGFRQFHASNTLPSENGGISGKKLRPYTLGLIRYMRINYDDCIIIAGGGIRNLKNVREYIGADHFSVSTLCFNPILFVKFYFEFTNQF
jgi:dihydroorotate dehydrogenase